MNETSQDLENTKVAAAAEVYGEAPKLDLSKIKNLKASENAGVITNEQKKNIETIARKSKKAKFCFTEEHEVKIPTGGKLYQDCDDEDIKHGIVRLKPMSLADEEIISNQAYIKNNTVFINLLNSCMLNDFDARNLVPYDVYFLIYALRQITYGQDYKFEITCANCDKNFEVSINMEEVDFDELEGEETMEKTVRLPASKYTVTLRNTTLGSEERATLMSKTVDNGELALSYAARTIAVNDNKGEPISPKDYPDFYEAIPGKDRAAITKLFENIDNLEIPKVMCTCPKCGNQEKMSIPFNKEFFRY